MKTSGLPSALVATIGLLGIGVESRIFAPVPPVVQAIASSAEDGGNATFEQLIDHSNPSLGTFWQQYWWDTTFWKGPGSPIVLFTPGEIGAEPYQGYLTNRTIVGQYAQAIGGATILLEHRYYGNSTPYEILDLKALQYLTLNNSVADMVNFARNVELPFDTNHSSNAPQAAWIQVGGSYSGALAAWNEKIAPGTYWAYHASSGPVEAIYNYWSYFLPIQHGMPKNCSKDLELVIEHVDSVLDKGDADEIAKLQKSFGLEGLGHVDDFAAALAAPLGEWQAIQQYSNYSIFFQMCDTIEGVRMVSPNNTNIGTNATIPSAEGVGLEKALSGFAAWFRVEYLPSFCMTNFDYADWNTTGSIGCLDTYNETSIWYTDLNVTGSINRQWTWFVCNEPFFYYQGGAPKNRSTIVSRHVTPEYFQHQCLLTFPDEGNYTFGSKAGRTADDVNAVTEGWNLTNTTRLLWANGEVDPWRSASVSSELRPGGPLESRPEAPLFLIPGSRHCNDLAWRNGDFNEDVRKAQNAEIAQIVAWVDEFSAEDDGDTGGDDGEEGE